MAVATRERPDKAVLDFLAEVLEDPDHWTKHHAALNAKGRSVRSTSDDVCKVCLIGGLTRFSSTPTQVKRLEQLVIRFAPNSFRSAIAFNDDPKTQHKHVLTALKAASNHLDHV